MTISTMNKDTPSFSGPPSLGSAKSKSGARFTLRKRSIRDDREMVNLSSYNSDFLSGLFADVAKVNVLSELGIQQKRSSQLIAPDDDLPLDEIAPTKKSRISFDAFSSRARSSTMNLRLLNDETMSPKGISEFFGLTTSYKHGATNEIERQDSLAYQLNCVSNSESDATSDESPKPVKTIMDVAKIAFPHLPATISDSSCSAGLTRVKLDRHVSNPENDYKESFGWFVDLEGDSTTPEISSGLPYAVSSDDLAFQAPTAPKRVNDDAELEWAKAADTVDDVLGDFF